MDILNRDKVLDLLKQRRNFLYKVYEQNKNSIAAAHHLEALETTEEIYEMIADMPYTTIACCKDYKYGCAVEVDGKEWIYCTYQLAYGSVKHEPYWFCADGKVEP